MWSLRRVTVCLPSVDVDGGLGLLKGAGERDAKVGVLRLASASASFSASHTIPVPGSTLLEFGTVHLAPTGIVIPRSMCVRVRVSGSVGMDVDPEWVRRFCNPGPPSECPPPYDGASAGPLGVDDGLEVQVAMNNAYFSGGPAPRVVTPRRTSCT